MTDGVVDYNKLHPIIFDIATKTYRLVGPIVGKAFRLLARKSSTMGSLGKCNAAFGFYIVHDDLLHAHYPDAMQLGMADMNIH